MLNLLCAILAVATPNDIPNTKDRLAQQAEPPEEQVVEAKYPDGKVRLRGSLVHGTREGTWEEYFPDGSVQRTTEFKHNSPHGRFAEWYPEEPGSIRQKKVEGAFVRGERMGPWTTWYPNGMIQTRVTWVEGKKDGGAWGGYDHAINGGPATRYVGNFVADEKEGEWTAHYPSGQIQAVYHYSKGKLHGIVKELAMDGQIRRSVTYVEGKREGEAIEYSATGKIIRKLSYKNDRETESQ